MLLKFFISTLIIFSSYCNASESICSNNSAIKESFLVKRDGRILEKEGLISERHSPCSTFKIPLSLMAYNENILIDVSSPEVPYDNTYQASREECRQACNPLKWIRHSCVWYSQIIAQKLGIEKFQDYVTQFNYGNKNLSGDTGKDNGLTQSWLSSSLQISVEEQVEFLEKFLHKQLPIRGNANEKTHDILYLEDFTKSFKLYGKTGSGNCFNPDGSLDVDRQLGWFVGWLEKDESKIIFALYVEDETKENISAGLRAKKRAKDKLLQIIEHDLFNLD